MNNSMLRRLLLITILALSLAPVLVGVSPARAQSTTVNITYSGTFFGAWGSGPASATVGDSIVISPTFDGNFGGQYLIDATFDECIYLKLTNQPFQNRTQDSIALIYKDCDGVVHDLGYTYNQSAAANAALFNQTFAVTQVGTINGGSNTFNFQFLGAVGITPALPAISKYAACPTQNDTGVLPGSWSYTPPVTADPSGIGLALNGGAIQKNFSLSRFHEYSMVLSYKLSAAGPPEAFTFAFGKNFAIQLITADDDTESTVTFPASTYEPNTSAAGADLFTVAIGAISPPVSPHLVINYFCLTDATAGAGAGDGTGGGAVATCKDCTYESSGNLITDFFGILKWLWCAISQLWDCTIKSLLYGVWKFIGVIITALAFARQWAGLILTNGGSWLGAVLLILWNFIRGLAGNIILAAFNALAGVFNSLGLSGVINTVLAFLADIPRGISQFLSFVPGIVSLISTVWDFVTYWVTTVWNLVAGILGAIPVVFSSVANGFNQSAASIPVYAPTCNSSNTLFFGPCLGMYIIDNTVFDGPMYYVFPLVLGFMALNTIMWSIEKMKEALSGD